MPPTRQSLASAPLPPAAFLILISLAESPSHGYQLRKELLTRSGGSIDLDPGSLYRLIFKLGDDGLIAPEEGDAGDIAEGRRRVYHLTRVGRAVLKAETQRLASLVDQARAVGVSAKRHA